MSVRVRIAPSPTGDPHVGTAYIALFNKVFAKANQGTFVLRIEDTDQARSRPEWETQLFEALGWLGLQWDEGPDVGGPHGPYRQSERQAIYHKHVQILIDKGAAYPCFCTPERLQTLRAEQQARKDSHPGYDGHCRAMPAQEALKRREAGETCVVRLAIPKEGQTEFCDRLRGAVCIQNIEIDDQVLLKSDGMPTYHLANVVDDHLMEISHVVRAEEWITSTPKHVLLYRAFGWQEPVWVHMPLLRNADRSKISKRKNPVSLNHYRDAGFLPAAMLNYLGMMGWTQPDGAEIFSFEDMVQAFDFDRISLGGPIFDVAKLSWLNGQHIRGLSLPDLRQKLFASVLADDYLNAVLALMQERVESLDDVFKKGGFFFVGELAYSEEACAAMVAKGRDAQEMLKAFQAVLALLDTMPTIVAADVQTALKALCTEIGFKPKELFMPLRLALTGQKATPGLFETMAVLGKERCRRRLRGGIGVLGCIKS